jgi:arylsulfatase
LKAEGLDSNTIVWFASDNGPWLIQGEDGGSSGIFRDGKGSTWEGGVRVPCFVSWPGTLKSQVNEQVVNAMDIYATCIKLAGGTIPSDRIIDGKDIRFYLNQTSVPEKKDTPFFYYGINNELMAVRKGCWKLHCKTYSQLNISYFGRKLPLLFDVYTDPSEKYDLSDSHPDIVKELLQLIEEQNRKVSLTGNFFDDPM